MIVVNTLIRWTFNKSIEDRIERVLWLNIEEDFAYVVDLNSSRMPYMRKVSEIEENLKEKVAVIEEKDPFIRIFKEEDITDLNRQKRDIAWEVISSIVIHEPLIFNQRHRAELINNAALKHEVTKRTVTNYLIRYWKRGKTKNALLPDFYLCGGRGKTRVISKSKLGRPRKYLQVSGMGINIDENIRKIFRIAVNKFYHTNAKNSLTLTYELMCKEFFVSEFKVENNITVPLLKPSSEIPSFGQFKYWFNKERDIKREIITRSSAKKYDQRHRAILGSSTSEAIGPGSIFQIDATVADVYLVSRFNRNWVVGRPIIYTIIDVFSRMIVGIYVGFEGPSWLGAMNAIANAASNKVDFCKQYEIEITEDEWPTHYLPETILADRGEIEGKGIENIIEGLHLRISNTPPFRAELKGIIEQHFHILNTRVKPFLPGVVDFDQRERGDKDYRLDAKLDIYQFTQVIIRCVLFHNNNHYLKNYNKEEMMIQDEIKPIPANLWNWGIKNRSGRLKNVSEDIVKLYLMPSGTAVVTAKGIKYKNIYYSSKTSLKENWFQLARNRGTWKIDISYDPRNMNNIYIKDVNGEGFEKCSILEHQSSLIDKSIEEIEYMQQKEKMDIESNSNSELQSKIDLISQIESIVKKAEKETDEETDTTESKRSKVKGIKQNRITEKMINREKEAFELKDEEWDLLNRTKGETVNVLEDEESYDDLSLIKKMQKEGLNRIYD